MLNFELSASFVANSVLLILPARLLKLLKNKNDSIKQGIFWIIPVKTSEYYEKVILQKIFSSLTLFSSRLLGDITVIFLFREF